jgi:hypothetical protein
MAEAYPFEDIRSFMVKRPWLHREEGDLLSPDEYLQIRGRSLVLDEKRATYLRAFIDGWKAAR